MRLVIAAVLVGWAGAGLTAFRLSAAAGRSSYHPNVPSTISFPSLSKVITALVLFVAGAGFGATAIVLGLTALVRRPPTVSNAELLLPVLAMVLGAFSWFGLLRFLL